MKIFYLSILTLFTIAQLDAATIPEAATVNQQRPREVTLEQVRAAVKRTGTPLADSDAASLTGSCAVSYTGSLGMASTIARHDVYTPTEVDGKSEAEKIAEYNKLLDAYTDLLAIMSRTDARLAQFVAGIDKALPKGIDRGEANEESLTLLQTAFRQLLDMYRTAKRSYNSKTGKVTLLESTIAELNTEQAELQATLATMAPRPTVFVGTDMSPARKAAIAADDIESSDVVVALRADKSRLATENARLQAEIAALKAAAKPAATGTAKTGIKAPLLSKDDRAAGGYTRLKDGEESRGRKKKDDACPCSVQ